MVELGQRAGLVAAVARDLEGHDPPHRDLAGEVDGGEGPLPRLGEHLKIVHRLAGLKLGPDEIGREAGRHRPLRAAQPPPDLLGPAGKPLAELGQLDRFAMGLADVILLADKQHRRSRGVGDLRMGGKIVFDPGRPPAADPELEIDLHELDEHQPPQSLGLRRQMVGDRRREAGFPGGDEGFEPLGHLIPGGGLFDPDGHAAGLRGGRKPGSRYGSRDPR